MIICRKCKQTLQRLAFQALLIDLGCQSNVRPDFCYDGERHDFIQEDEDEQPTAVQRPDEKE